MEKRWGLDKGWYGSMIQSSTTIVAVHCLFILEFLVTVKMISRKNFLFRREKKYYDWVSLSAAIGIINY